MKEAKNLLINQSITREAVEELECLCLDIYFKKLPKKILVTSEANTVVPFRYHPGGERIKLRCFDILATVVRFCFVVLTINWIRCSWLFGNTPLILEQRFKVQ